MAPGRILLKSFFRGQILGKPNIKPNIIKSSPVSEEWIRIEKWVQDTRGGLTISPRADGFRLNSNLTAASEAGVLVTPDDVLVPAAKAPTPY